MFPAHISAGSQHGMPLSRACMGPTADRSLLKFCCTSAADCSLFSKNALLSASRPATCGFPMIEHMYALLH